MPRPKPKSRAARRAERRADRNAGGGSRRRASYVDREGNRRIPPVLWILIALGCVVAIPLIAQHGYQAVQSGELVAERRMCSATAQAPCLEKLRGELRGPFWTRRQPGHGWALFVDGVEVDEFDLVDSADETVQPLRNDATVLARGGDVAAVVLPEDKVLPVWGLGWRGAAQALLLNLGCAGGAVGAVSFGWLRRQALGSWWRVAGGEYVSPASPWATFLCCRGRWGSWRCCSFRGGRRGCSS